jgi:hypothetical protein
MPIAAALSLLLLGFASSSANASTPTIPQVSHIEPRYDVPQATTPNNAASTGITATQSPLFTPITDFTKSISDGGTSFTFQMIGKNPFTKALIPATTINTYIQPVKLVLANGDTFDPSTTDTCDSAASPLSRVQKSPLFVATPWTFGLTSMGTTQYEDATQRAAFYQQTKAGALNPGYHITLTQQALPTITLHVPVDESGELTIACGNHKFAAVQFNWFDNQVRSTVLPAMATHGVTLKDLPLVLVGRAGFYFATPDDCCALGYHGAQGNNATFQSYAVAFYDNTGIIPNSGDVSALSHELSEWINDPAGTNPTPTWGHIGQVTGCQSNLETGDPLSGTIKAKVESGFTYHVQELAFYSWFYHQRPSQGIGGWYSNFGKFRTPSAPCS